MADPPRPPGANTGAVLYDATGKPVLVDDSTKAAEAYKTGAALPVRGQLVPMYNPTSGKIEGVAAEDVEQGLQAGGRFATQNEFRETQITNRWEKTGGTEKALNLFNAANQGFARGASFGLSDVVIGEAAKLFLPNKDAREVREYMRDMKELHNITATAGEVAGAVVGAKGAGLGRTARALIPAAGIEAGVAALEQGVLRTGAQSLGTGVGQILTRGVAGGLRAGAEGLLAGAGRTLSEAELGDTPLNAEKLIANMGHDGLLYGAIGGTIGGATGAIGAASSYANKAIRQEAALQAVRAINPLSADIRLLNKTDKEEYVKFGSWLLEKDMVRGGETFEKVGERMDQFATDWAGKMDAFASKMGKSEDSMVDAIHVINRAREEVVAPLLKKPGMEPYAAEVEKYLASLESKVRPPATYADQLGAAANDNAWRKLSFSEARDFRAGLDDILKRSYESLGVPAIGKTESMAVRKIFEEEITKAVERVSKTTGEKGLALEYGLLKRDYRYLKTADKILDKAAARELVKGLGFVLPHYMFGLGGALTGAALGGPVGALKGFALGMGQKVLRERGNSTAATLLHSLADLGEMKQALNHVDGQIDQSVAWYFSKGPTKLRAYDQPEDQRETLSKRFEREYAASTGFMAEPDKVAEAMQHTIGPWAVNAPGHQAAATSKVLQGYAFLAGKAPQPKEPVNGLQPTMGGQVKYSDSDMSSFLRYNDAVKRPMQVLKDLRNGSITKEQVETLKAVYPNLYTEVVKSVLTHVAKETEAGRTVSYQKRLQLSQMLGTPLDRTQDPRFIALLAQARQATPQPKAAPRGRPKSIDGVGNAFQTEYDQREAKGSMR